MSLPSYAGRFETVWYYIFRIICGCVLFFLIAPIVVLIPLSFNTEPYFTFTQGMLTLDPDAFSMRWYQDILDNPQWIMSIENSVIIITDCHLSPTALSKPLNWVHKTPEQMVCRARQRHRRKWIERALRVDLGMPD